MKKFILCLMLFWVVPSLADVIEPGWGVLPHSFLQHNHISSVLFAMFLTAIVETFFLWCFKYRGWKVLIYFVILNLISNCLVNFGVAELPFYICSTFLDNACFSGGNILDTVYYSCIAFFEIGAVLFEASLLGLMVGYNKKLWLSVFATNLISFLLGILLFGL